MADLAMNRVRVVLMAALGTDVKPGLAWWKFGEAFIAPGQVGVVDMAALETFHEKLRAKKNKKADLTNVRSA